MQFLTKLSPVIIVFTTTFGMVFHEMHIDRATTVAVAMPALIASAATMGGLEKIISNNYHTHVERGSLPKLSSQFRTPQPNMQPRDDNRRYQQSKKLLFSGGDAASYWPSV